MKKQQKQTPFMERMTRYRFLALEGESTIGPCAKELVPNIESFFESAKNIEEAQAKRKDSDWAKRRLVSDVISLCVVNLAHTTREGEKISEKEIGYINKIFEEIHSLVDETLRCDSKECLDNVVEPKVMEISEILSGNMMLLQVAGRELIDPENWRSGLVFQKYEDIWKVIHRVNTEWEDLCSRGFRSKVVTDYFETFRYEVRRGIVRSEEEKFSNFMAVLDGEMKFVPVYELRPKCFKVVGKNEKENHIEVDVIEHEVSSKSYAMISKDAATQK